MWKQHQLHRRPTPQHSKISDATLSWRSLRALARQAGNSLSAFEDVYSWSGCEQLMTRIPTHLWSLKTPEHRHSSAFEDVYSWSRHTGTSKDPRACNSIYKATVSHRLDSK